MDKNQHLYRVGLVSVSLLLILAMLAIALPQQATAAGSDDAKTDPNAVFSTYIRNNRVYVDLAAPKERVKFRVRTKDAARSFPKWYELGTLIAEKKQGVKVSYPVPNALKKTLHIDVCLKNQHTNRLTCHKVYNPGQ